MVHTGITYLKLLYTITIISINLLISNPSDRQRSSEMNLTHCGAFKTAQFLFYREKKKKQIHLQLWNLQNFPHLGLTILFSGRGIYQKKEKFHDFKDSNGLASSLLNVVQSLTHLFVHSLVKSTKNTVWYSMNLSRWITKFVKTIHDIPATCNCFNI